MSVRFTTSVKTNGLRATDRTLDSKERHKHICWFSHVYVWYKWQMTNGASKWLQISKEKENHVELCGFSNSKCNVFEHTHRGLIVLNGRYWALSYRGRGYPRPEDNIEYDLLFCRFCWHGGFMCGQKEHRWPGLCKVCQNLRNVIFKHAIYLHF